MEFKSLVSLKLRGIFRPPNMNDHDHRITVAFIVKYNSFIVRYHHELTPPKCPRMGVRTLRPYATLVPENRHQIAGQ
jgi:hypothetical protein